MSISPRAGARCQVPGAEQLLPALWLLHLLLPGNVHLLPFAMATRPCPVHHRPSPRLHLFSGLHSFGSGPWSLHCAWSQWFPACSHSCCLSQVLCEHLRLRGRRLQRVELQRSWGTSPPSPGSSGCGPASPPLYFGGSSLRVLVGATWSFPTGLLTLCPEVFLGGQAKSTNEEGLFTGEEVLRHRKEQK